MNKILTGKIEFRRGSIVDSTLNVGVIAQERRLVVAYPKDDLDYVQYNHIAGNYSYSDLFLILEDGSEKSLIKACIFDDASMAIMFFNK